MSEGAEATLSLFAAAAPGVEPIVARELASLGVRDATVDAGGVAFTGTFGDLMRANLHLRTASRVLVRLAEFRATSFHELERGARRVAWEQALSTGQTTRLRVTCRKSRLYHSDAVAQRIASAVARVTGADVEKTTAVDEDIEAEDEAQLLVVRVRHDRVTISADSSGDLLHRRGYRKAVGKAPLRETLAAAMVLESGWTPGMPLLDPLCGSGTIVIEAALIARSIAPGLDRAQRRAFAFTRWPAHEPARLAELIVAARKGIVALTGGALRGSDRDAGAVEAARANASRAGVGDDVLFEELAISALRPAPEAGFVITNPPYGVRVGESAMLRNLYEAFGRVLRERFVGWGVTMLSPAGPLEARLRIPLAPVLTTRNGGIPVRLVVGRVGAGQRFSDAGRD